MKIVKKGAGRIYYNIQFILILNMIISSIFAQNIWINEFHYDDPGADSDEAIEIVAPSDFTDLTGVTLTLYNGSASQLVPYGSHTLDSFEVGETLNGFTIYSKYIAGIQNGAPDGFSLDYNGELIQFLSYEGTFVAIEGPAENQESVDVGVSEPDEEGQSIQLVGSGSLYSNFMWVDAVASSFGTTNSDQTLGGEVGNFPPTANAGADQQVSAGSTVTLDGSGSSDSDGMVISYEWVQIDGNAVTLSDYESDIVTFTAPDDGDVLEFQLTVWDEELDFDTDNIIVTICSGLVSIEDAREAGVDQCLSIQGVVTSPNFQSSNSEYTVQDASAGIVLLVWDIDLGLNYGDEIMAIGITDEYNGKFELVVDNPENITVIGPGTLPEPQVTTIYEFMDDAESFESEVITLENVTLIEGTWPEEDSWANLIISDGSNETTLRIDNDTDIDGSLEPAWPVNVTGVGGQYDSSDPYDSGYQILSRFVSDFEASDGNMLPIANAGENQFVSGGDEVILNGIYSYDPDGEIVGYTWIQTEGIPVTLSDYEEAEVTFTAPMDEGVLTFDLEVFDDSGASNFDDVSIIVVAGTIEIEEIQAANEIGEGYDCYPSPYANQMVTVTGVVTAVQPGENPNFYIQDPNADSFGGVWVYDNTLGPDLGDELLISAEVVEYFGLTELQNVMASTTISTGNIVASTTITTGVLAEGCSLNGESYEGMLVRLENVTVMDEPSEYGEWHVDDGSGPCQIDDQMFDGDPEVFSPGTVIGSITGVVDYSFEAYGVNPRNADDIDLEGGCVANGDTNQDESVDVLDIVQIVGAILGNIEFTDDQFCIGDVNEDSSIDVLDVVMVVNIILTPRTDDATSATLRQHGLDVFLSADGYIGAVQITITHSDEFDIELTDHAFVTDHITTGNITKLIIVAPSTEYLFTAMNNFEIQEVVATNSSNYINVDVPESFLLLSSYPNPFNPDVTLSYFLPSDDIIELAIYSMTGTKVAILTNGFQLSGNYQVNWDGKDVMGNQVSSGIYLARLINGDNEITNKITLLK